MESAKTSLPEVGRPFNPYKLFTGAFIPEAVCKYRGLSPGAKLVYGRLCRYAGKDGRVFPAVPTLSEEIGVTANQGRLYLKELERARFLAVDRKNKHYRKNGSGGTNTYFFRWHQAFNGEHGTPRRPPPRGLLRPMSHAFWRRRR